MKLALPYALATLLALTSPALAQSPYDGVWRVDLASAQFSDKPYVVSIENGTFTCSSCMPAYTVPADGQMHRVEGFDYWDEISVRIVDGRTVEDAQKHKGRAIGTSRSRVSADGATLTSTWTDTSAPGGTVSTGETTMTRTAPAAAGAHAMSGSWSNAAVSNVSAEAVTATVRLADDMFSFSTGAGYAYQARLGGPAVPITGDLAGATATVRQLSDGSIEQTERINGEARSVTTLTPAADGSISVKVQNLRSNTTTSYRVVKQ